MRFSRAAVLALLSSLAVGACSGPEAIVVTGTPAPTTSQGPTASSQGPTQAPKAATCPATYRPNGNGFTPSPSTDVSKWTAGRSTPVAEPTYPTRGTADLDTIHYGLDLKWEPTSKVFSGTATVHLRATRDLPRLTLDFSCSYEITEAAVNGKRVTASTSADHRVALDQAVQKDAPVVVKISYRGTPQPVKAPSKRDDVPLLGLRPDGDGELWTMQEPFGALTWYPVNELPSDKALYDISITAPAGWAGVASGTQVATTGQTNRFTTTDPVASYLTTLAVGRFTKDTGTGPRGLPLSYWHHGTVRPEADELASMRKSPAFITWLEAKFGPYPFPSAGAVIVSSDSAMETQQMITMRPRGESDTDGRRFEATLVHEYAHHWFGDTVTPKTWKDLWLNEGWATYAQYLYTAERDGTPDAILDRDLATIDREGRGESGPPGSPRADDFAGPSVYGAAANMLRQIHNKVGDEAFFTMARGWVQQHKNSSADRSMFIAHVNRSTGQDLTAMINTWLDSPTTPGMSARPPATGT